MGKAGMGTQALRARCAAKVMELCKSDYDWESCNDDCPIGWALCVPTGAALGDVMPDLPDDASRDQVFERADVRRAQAEALRVMRDGGCGIAGRLGIVLWVRGRAWAEAACAEAQEVVNRVIDEELGRQGGRQPATGWARGLRCATREVAVGAYTVNERQGWSSKVVSGDEVMALATRAKASEATRVRHLVESAGDGAQWRLRRQTGMVRSLYLGLHDGRREAISLGDVLVLWSDGGFSNPKPHVALHEYHMRPREDQATMCIGARPLRSNAHDMTSCVSTVSDLTVCV